MNTWQQINCIAYSPDGTTCASAADDDVVKIWNCATADAKRTLPHDGNVLDLAFSPDGRILATIVQAGKSISLWSTENGRLVKTIPTAGSVRSMAYSPDGKLLGIGYDATNDYRVQLVDFTEYLPYLLSD